MTTVMNRNNMTTAINSEEFFLFLINSYRLNNSLYNSVSFYNSKSASEEQVVEIISEFYSSHQKEFSNEHEYFYSTFDKSLAFASRSGQICLFWGKNPPAQELCEKLKKLEEVSVRRPPSNAAYVVIQRGGRLGLRLVETPKRSANPELYQDYDKVEQAINLLKVSMKEKTPKGRLLVFSGPPGTGKTSLVSSLIDSKRWTPVLITPDQVATLQDPAFIELLTDAKQGKKPLLLIVEDADSCLQSRSKDNMSRVQAVLNLTDGLLSNALDLFLVCTTNLKSLDIDTAVHRPGRLLAHLDIKHLSAEKATALSAKLGYNQQFSGPATLAEVYSNNSTLVHY